MQVLIFFFFKCQMSLFHFSQGNIFHCCKSCCFQRISETDMLLIKLSLSRNRGQVNGNDQLNIEIFFFSTTLFSCHQSEQSTKIAISFSISSNACLFSQNICENTYTAKIYSSLSGIKKGQKYHIFIGSLSDHYLASVLSQQCH